MNGNDIYIKLLVIEKGKGFEMPELLINFSYVRRDYDLPDWARSRVNINFSKNDLVILYLDPLKLDENPPDKLFRIVHQITGISKPEIKGKIRNDEIAFARQLYHYFYVKMEIGGKNGVKSNAARETNNSHATVIWSIKVVKDVIETDKDWRKSWYDELKKELKLI